MTTPHPANEPRPSVPALPDTLEQLLQQKAALRQEIQTQKATLARMGYELTAPFTPAVQKGNSVLRAFNRGMAVVDGVMLGLKMMRKVKNLFGRKGRYRY